MQLCDPTCGAAKTRRARAELNAQDGALTRMAAEAAHGPATECDVAEATHCPPTRQPRSCRQDEDREVEGLL